MEKLDYKILCKIHNITEEHQGVKTDEQFQAQKISFCQLCNEKREYQFQENFQKVNIIQQFQSQSKKNLETINTVLTKFQEVKQQLNNIIDEYINYFRDLTQIIINGDEKLKMLFQFKNAPSIQQIEKQHQTYKIKFEELQQNFQYKMPICIDQLKQLLNVITSKKFELPKIINEFPLKDYYFKPLEQSKLKQKEHCQILAFNLDDTILAAGCGDKIVIFHFIDKKLIYDNQVQMEGQVVYLKFISEESNKFLSIIDKDSLQILEQDLKKNFIIKKKFLIYGDVSCVDLSLKWMAMGSSIGNIQLWKQKRDEWCCEQFIDHDLDQILSVSFNKSCDKFITGGKNGKISLFQRDGFMDEWILSQSIFVQSEILRIKFFGDLQFLVYESKINQLSIFNIKGKKFEKEMEKQLQGNGKDTIYYPIGESKNGFVVKHSNYLSFLNYSQRNKRCDLNIQMYFENEKFQGCLSNTEEYLITWDEASKELQVKQWAKLID